MPAEGQRRGLHALLCSPGWNQEMVDPRYSPVDIPDNTSWPKRQRFDSSSPTMTHKAWEAMWGGQCIQRHSARQKRKRALRSEACNALGVTQLRNNFEKRPA